MAVESRSFDRAAPFYDQTRGLPAAAAAAVTWLLAAELAGRGRVLEIGVGTGRIALPLHDTAGLDLVGIDLSSAMMAVLVDKAGGGVPFPLARADATALPFADGRFGAAIASHVFHLIPAWRDALAELMRVVGPGGLILSSRGGREQGGVLQEVRRHLRREAGAQAGHVGASDTRDDVEEALRALGAGERTLPAVRAVRSTTVGTMISSLAAGQWSWTWSVPEADLQAAADRTRAWATETYGNLDDPVDVELTVTWRAFDLP